MVERVSVLVTVSVLLWVEETEAVPEKEAREEVEGLGEVVTLVVRLLEIEGEGEEELHTEGVLV